jgi:hypothetical protein
MRSKCAATLIRHHVGERSWDKLLDLSREDRSYAARTTAELSEVSLDPHERPAAIDLVRRLGARLGVHHATRELLCRLLLEDGQLDEAARIFVGTEPARSRGMARSLAPAVFDRGTFVAAVERAAGPSALAAVAALASAGIHCERSAETLERGRREAAGEDREEALLSLAESGLGAVSSAELASLASSSPDDARAVRAVTELSKRARSAPSDCTGIPRILVPALSRASEIRTMAAYVMGSIPRAVGSEEVTALGALLHDENGIVAANAAWALRQAANSGGDVASVLGMLEPSEPSAPDSGDENTWAASAQRALLLGVLRQSQCEASPRPVQEWWLHAMVDDFDGSRVQARLLIKRELELDPSFVEVLRREVAQDEDLAALLEGGG